MKAEVAGTCRRKDGEMPQQEDEEGKEGEAASYMALMQVERVAGGGIVGVNMVDLQRLSEFRHCTMCGQALKS
jgi:hypothetical protein